MEHAASVLNVMNWSNTSKSKVSGMARARKLSDTDINEIIDSLSNITHLKGKWGYGNELTTIADKYNVTVQTIRNISNGKIPCYRNSIMD